MSKTIEEWKPVIGYEGLYEVSDWGNIKSVDRVFEYYHPSAKRTIKRSFKGKILKKILNNDGYHVVSLLDYNHNRKEGKVHRLVAEAFIPNPDNKPIVGHTKTLENGLEDKTANEVWNIAWMTQSENLRYGTVQERLSKSKVGDKNPNYGKKLSEEVRNKMSEVKKEKYLKQPESLLPLFNSDKHYEKRKIKINQYNKITDDFIKTWDSAADIEREMGICHSNISACCNGKVKSAGDYKWRYYEN